MKNKIERTNTRQLVFILGHSLGHSLSPAMHNAVFESLGLSWTYMPLEVKPDQVKTVVSILRAINVQGANVTVPYKEAVLRWLDRVEPEAGWLGSVNTVYRSGKKLCGTSTDGEGFLRSLGHLRWKLRGSMGILLGAGGAGKAVAGALARSGVKGFFVADLASQRAEALAKLVCKRYRRLQTAAISIHEAEKLLPRCEWVVQATSTGLKNQDPSPLPLKAARPGVWVVDLIYHHRTAFLREAQARHLPNLNGLGMLLHQGALSFEYWTGRKAPLKIMKRALLQCLAQG